MFNNKVLLITVDGFKLCGPVDLEEDVIPDIIEDEEDTPDEEDEEETDDDESEEEEEDDKKEDEEPELARFTLDEIKAAFKDNPEGLKQARHAFFREQQFTEIFPTVEEAQKAADAQLAYESITEAVVGGDTDKFFAQLKEASSSGMEKFSKNFFPSLMEVDKDLALDVATPIVKRFLNNVYEHSKTMTNEQDKKNVANAAKIVRRVLFGGSFEEIESDKGILAKEKKEESEVDKDKKEYFAKKYNDLYTEVANLCNTKLDEEINKGLDDLTKTKPGLKRILAKQIRDAVRDKMQTDKNHLARMNSLWHREDRNGFSGTLKQSLLTTFMAKAKSLVPKERALARKEALGKEDKEEKEPSRLTGGRQVRGTGKSAMTPERAKAEGLSTVEILRGGKK
jgi:hypothetical protein